MISTAADHGLYIPDLSTTPIIATRCRGDVLVDVAIDVVFLPVPPGDVDEDITTTSCSNDRRS